MERFEGKKLLLLGGVRPACEIVKEARAMGVETFVTDYLENSPAKQVADHAFMVNAVDTDAVAALCREQQIDGVITGYVDLLLPYYQKICEKAGKPFWGNAENIEMSINKEQFKAACERSGVPVVPYRNANKDNYIEVIKEIEPPVVVKPVDNSGSRGVFKCYDKDMLKECAEKALSFSKSGEILIEEAMNPQTEFSAYYIMNHGEYFFTGMGDRYVNITEDDIAPVGQGMLFPSVRTKAWAAQMDPIIRKFFKDNAMNDGFVFVQGFTKGSDFYIHEIGYRLNGGFSYKIIEYFSGYNQVQELIKFALTGDMDHAEIAKSNPFYDGYGMIVTATLKPGTIGSVSGVEEIEKLDGVLQFYQLHTAGEKLMAHGTTAQVFAYILCAVRTEAEMKQIIRTVSEKLKVLDENGENLLKPIVDPEKIKFKGE